MTLIDLLTASDAPVVLNLLANGEPCGAVNHVSAWDNRPTWDNKGGGGGFDNRPSWDNWSKR